MAKAMNNMKCLSVEGRGIYMSG